MTDQADITVAALHGIERRYGVVTDRDAECVAIALREAAPLIAAAERERIRQLAIDRDATAWNAPLDANECHRVEFADLLTEGDTT